MVKRNDEPTGRRRTSPPAPSHPGFLRRWWKRITATIVSLGAVAAALTAILSVRLPHDVEDTAKFTDIRAISGVPLSEYQQRLATVVPKAFGVTSPGPGTAKPGTKATVTTTSTSTKSSSCPGNAVPTGCVATLHPTTPTTSPASSSQVTSPAPGSFRLPIGLDQDNLHSRVGEVVRRAETDPKISLRCPDDGRDAERCLPVLRMLNATSVSPEGDPVTPDVAVEHVLKILKNARTTPRKEPVGAIVSVDVELGGLRGRTLLLTWSMWQNGGKTRLHGDWLNSNLVYRLQPTTDHDTTTVDLWVPLPKAAGTYFVRVDLDLDGARLIGGNSPSFE
ncbi:hypothetical protein [Amycolatopsis sp. NPDC003731]